MGSSSAARLETTVPARRARALLVIGLLLGAATLAAPGVRAGEDPGPGPGARLPDLAVLPPSSLRIVVRTSGKKILRFTSVIVNVGRGPFQLTGFAEDGYANRKEILNVRQQIREADGTLSSHDTPATMFWSGDGHNHWHVTGIQVAKLNSLAAGGTGSYAKTGFCFLDSYRYKGKHGSTYTPANNVCQTRANGKVRMGTSIGWADVYPSTIAFQWIDITGLPDGKYRLKIIADPTDVPGGAFLESDETNNKGWVKIRIQGTSVKILKRSARP